MTTIRRIETRELLAFEQAVEFVCKMFKLPQKINDMCNMLAARTFGENVLNETDLSLYALTCFMTVFAFYEMPMEADMYFILGKEKFSDEDIKRCEAFILKHFPSGGMLYLDQFLAPAREERRFNVPVSVNKLSILPTLKTNLFTMCGKCDKLKRANCFSLDFDMFCSDECRGNAFELFDF